MYFYLNKSRTCLTTISYHIFPQAIWSQLFSIFDQTEGMISSGSISQIPLASAIPSYVGIKVLFSPTVTYPLSIIFLMWDEIEASVPIQFSSIYEINVASVRNPGGLVCFSINYIEWIYTELPSLNTGSSLSPSLAPRKGAISRKPLKISFLPVKVKSSSPILSYAFYISYFAFFDKVAKKF